MTKENSKTGDHPTALAGHTPMMQHYPGMTFKCA
jgi:hypothetical protein